MGFKVSGHLSKSKQFFYNQSLGETGGEEACTRSDGGNNGSNIDLA